MKRGVESHVRDRKSLDLISALLITAEKMVTPSPQHETLLNHTQNIILLPLWIIKVKDMEAEVSRYYRLGDLSGRFSVFLINLLDSPKHKCIGLIFCLFSRVLRDSTTRYVSPSVSQSVGWSVGWAVGRLVPFLLFRRFLAFWAYGTCPDDPVTFSSTAPAHPHTTRAAMYPALFLNEKCHSF